MDTRRRLLVTREEPRTPVGGRDPYVLTFVSGTPQRALERWSAAAVDARFTERFLDPADGRSVPQDLTQVATAFNDWVTARRAGGIGLEIAQGRKMDEDVSELTRKRNAVLENVQDETLRGALLG
ncbi:hypothetical protein GTQ99_11690 [Kineococcus sp. T13]|uniref:hypothetical protein n=1 Tax=Kineococcus vitellinus TaxID=2696565 RepID=UPI001411D5AD|nr:hypothetical protein [Kineococcus vitellinus]NAZ76068.1 hypothetical protein [Kineococcus vitellinus]